MGGFTAQINEPAVAEEKFDPMTTRAFATVCIRVLGVAAIVCGGISVGSAGIMQAIGTYSQRGESTSELHLHDTYYVIAHIDAWLVSPT